MDLDDLAQHVGADRFRRACAQAVADAPGEGRSSAPDQETDEAWVPHELSDLVEGDLDLAIALYRVMPCYANLMYVEHWAPRDAMLREVVALLDEPDDALADPASYWLWCGPFEGDGPESAAAWEAARADAPERRLRRLLDVSGPVPWSAKGPTLLALADDAVWHPAIWRAVRDAAVDYFGRVDPRAAGRLIDRLPEPPDDIDVVDLRRRLGTSST